MLYSEFVLGTGCKENDHNYEVYKNLEIMYMNSDMSKAEIYEYGKKLVDNSKTEEEIELERGIKEEIEYHKEEVKRFKEYLADEVGRMDYWKTAGDKEMVGFIKRSVDYYKSEIKEHKRMIAGLNWVLGK